MNHQEMLFAAEVNRLAREMRNFYRDQHLEHLKNAPDKLKKIEEWDNANPVKPFVVSAYRDITATAKHILQIQEEDLQKTMSGLSSAIAFEMPKPTV